MIDRLNSAFPANGSDGINIRTYLAGLAMQGILAGDRTDNGGYEDEADLAEACVAYADALIQSLNQIYS